MSTSDRISAAELRAMGFTISVGIPDCATVPRSALDIGKPTLAFDAATNRVEARYTGHLSAPFEWAEVTVAVPRPATAEMDEVLAYSRKMLDGIAVPAHLLGATPPALRVTAAPDYLRPMGTCDTCGSEVDDFLGNAALIAARPDGARWDYWAACSNPDCEHAEGEGYDPQDPLAWVLRALR